MDGIGVQLKPEERIQLASTLNCNDSDLDAQLDKFAAAATEEYVRMVLGQRVFTRGADIREYRLYLLISHVFAGLLPSDQMISSLFQTTTSQSRALLRSVMSKYQYELQTPIARTMRRVLEAAGNDPNVNGGRLLTIDSENIIEALNRRLAGIDGSLPQVRRVTGTVGTYQIAPSTYSRLVGNLP